MKCPYCLAADTRVIDSRGSGDGLVIRRRRECVSCNRRFTTHEQVAGTSLFIVKKDATRVPFDRERIRKGIAKACYKRPIAQAQIDDLVARVETELVRSGEQEIASSRVGELVMNDLRSLDQVAYVRFASVYREFKDISDFEEEIRPMLTGDTK